MQWNNHSLNYEGMPVGLTLNTGRSKHRQRRKSACPSKPDKVRPSFPKQTHCSNYRLSSPARILRGEMNVHSGVQFLGYLYLKPKEALGNGTVHLEITLNWEITSSAITKRMFRKILVRC
jgi:hypothetical protein